MRIDRAEAGMLEASVGEWGAGTTGYHGRTLAELDALVDRLAAAPTLSSSGEGAMGDHAWLSVIDRGFVAHFYFGEGCRDGLIGFELYGPYPPGTERQHADPYDGTGLSGSMTVTTLKEVLRLLDSGSCPVAFVRGAAVDVSVVADE
jgi:hypothetical protein